MSVALIEPVEMTATLNVVVSINSTTVMQTYCGILKEIGWYEKSCGFICGKEDLATWNTLEVAKILPLCGYWKNYN